MDTLTSTEDSGLVRTTSGCYKEQEEVISMPVTVSKTKRIDVRVSPAAKDTLQMAATQVNKTVSQFLLDAGLTAAAETLEDRRSFVLDKQRWNAFLKILDRPAREKHRLARLLAERSALE
ncbi:MAG TPA: DUF1778 domain-containing protein [Candidatus Binataceae bacterium]|nr:DUF1778 domain-containing protein [Candidatus Binataceae bacterium]